MATSAQNSGPGERRKALVIALATASDETRLIAVKWSANGMQNTSVLKVSDFLFASHQVLTDAGSIGNINSNNTIAGRDIINNFYGHGRVNQRLELAEWVSRLDFSPYQYQALEKRTRGTLGWVLRNPVFLAWLEGKKGGMIWGSGKAGAGKTTLVSFVVDHLENLGDEDPNAVAAVCYLYCRYHTTLTVLQMFAAILQQLILRCSQLEMEDIQRRKDQRRPLSLDDILSILRDCRIPNIFIIVDAFDECFDESTRGEVLRLLQSLPVVKTLITSRPSIENLMHGIPSFIIVATPEDLQTHFRAQVDINPELANLVSKAVGAIDVEAQLIEKADGMFLLAALHTADLMIQTNMDKFLEALKNLPKEALATYHHTLDRIRQQNPNKQRIAFRCLSWLLFALHPLSMIELQHALATHDFERMATENELTDQETIISSCAGLVVVNKRRWHGQEIATVNFLHYTVKEFLQEACATQDFVTDIGIALLSMKIPSFPNIQVNPPNHPLIEYATSVWGPLVKQYEDCPAIRELTLSQLRQPETIRVLSGARISDEMTEVQAKTTASYLMAIFDLTKIWQTYMDIKDFYTARSLIESHMRTALLWAVKTGHLKLVEKLLHHPSIEVNSQDEFGHTALSWSAERGQYRVVKLLVSHPSIDINSRDKSGRTPLRVAAEKNSSKVVRELLFHPSIDINAKDDQLGRSPLSWAAEQGYLEVVIELLFHPNIDVDAKDHAFGRTSLFWAARRGHSDVVQHLLRYSDVDVNAEDNFGQTLLCLAAMSGHSNVVAELLLQPDIDVDTTDYGSRTPLSWAAGRGHSEVVKQLLCSPGVDINLRDDIYERAPLHWAIDPEPLLRSDSNLTSKDVGHGSLVGRAQLDVVKQLLHHPNSDISSRDKYGQTPLSLAATNAIIEVVKELLLHPNIDANFGDYEGSTPLCWAARRGHLDIVKELSHDPRISVDLGDKHGTTPLLFTAMNGNTEVVKELLRHPKINVNARGHLRHTPLTWAAAGGHLAVVKLLLRHPRIEPDSKEASGRTALSLAAANGHSKVVLKLLLYPAVDVNSKDNAYGRTPLAWAVKGDHLDVVKLLLGHSRVDVDAKDTRGQIPVSLTSNLEIVDEFVRNGQQHYGQL